MVKVLFDMVCRCVIGREACRSQSGPQNVVWDLAAICQQSALRWGARARVKVRGI